MTTLAAFTTDSALIAGLGSVMLLVQFLSMMFRRKGEHDPEAAETRENIKSTSAIVGQIAVAVSSIETKIVGLNEKIEKQVLATVIESQRTLDSINAVNTTLHRRVDILDERVHGKDGLTDVVTRHEVEVQTLRKSIERLMNGGPKH